jgi:hypothetical protein
MQLISCTIQLSQHSGPYDCMWSILHALYSGIFNSNRYLEGCKMHALLGNIMPPPPPHQKKKTNNFATMFSFTHFSKPELFIWLRLLMLTDPALSTDGNLLCSHPLTQHELQSACFLCCHLPSLHTLASIVLNVRQLSIHISTRFKKKKILPLG